jgi:hypothetical protein
MSTASRVEIDPELLFFLDEGPIAVVWSHTG